MAAPMLLDDEVVGALSLCPHRGRPVRRSGHRAARGVRRAGGGRRPQRAPRARARGARRRARPQGRAARGAERGRRRGQLEPGARRGALEHHHERRALLGLRRRIDHGVRRGGALLLGAQRLREQCRAARASCAGSASSSRPRSSAGPRWRGIRSRWPTSTRSTSTRTCSCSTTTAGGRCSPCRCCAASGSSARSSCAARRPGDFSDETIEFLETFASQSALAVWNARLFRELETKTAELRGGQPAQVRVPREHVARAAHAAERRDRLLGGAAGADVRRAQRPPGRVPPRHPRARAGTCCSCSTTSSTSPRSRRAGWSSSRRRSRSARPSSTASRWCASGRRLHGIDGHASRSTPTLDTIDSDELRFKQVLLNLLSNAVKFTPDGGHVARGGPARRRRPRAVTVTDDGVGHPARGPRAHLRVVPAGPARRPARGGHGPRADPVPADRRAARRHDVARDRARAWAARSASPCRSAAPPRTTRRRPPTRTRPAGRGGRRRRPRVARPDDRLPRRARRAGRARTGRPARGSS